MFYFFIEIFLVLTACRQIGLARKSPTDVHMAIPILTTGQDCSLACELIPFLLTESAESFSISHEACLMMSPSSHTHAHCYCSLERNLSEMMHRVRNEPLH